MGLISGIQAITAVQKIKQGGTAKLSIAQIAELIINLPDAQKIRQKINLIRFMTFITSTKKCKTKLPHNYETYVATAIKIIKLFDAIAPYEKYSGGNELEFSYFMNEIRGE